MSAYGIAHLRNVKVGPQIVEYLQRIDATLEPFGGRFIVHGGAKDVLEGEWPGDLIVIEFPDRQAARQWYGSPAYAEIKALRTDYSEGDLVIVDGVSADHKAIEVLG